jgi:hypothetical protein
LALHPTDEEDSKPEALTLFNRKKEEQREKEERTKKKQERKQQARPRSRRFHRLSPIINKKEIPA